MDTQPRPAAMAELIRRLPHNGQTAPRSGPTLPRMAIPTQSTSREYRFLYVGGGEELGGYPRPYAVDHDRTKPCPRVNIVDVEAVSDRIRTALLKVAIYAGVLSPSLQFGRLPLI